MCALRFEPSHGTDRFDYFDRYFNSRHWEARPPDAYDDILFVIVYYHGTLRVRKYTTTM
jgi:hypothetical protein